MNNFSRIFSAAIMAILVGCVVIPDTFEARIYIDIRHIEAQADGFLDYVEGKSDELPSFDAPAGDQNSRLGFLPVQIAALWSGNVAYAAELNDSSPRVQQIADSMKRRYSELKQVKSGGGVGENNRGLVEVIDTGAFSSAEEQNEVQRLIASENEDRKALYKEVARLNSDQGVSVSSVEGVYALKHFQRASSGEKVQLPPPGANFDDAKNSATGQRIGAACAPSAWVTVP